MTAAVQLGEPMKKLHLAKGLDVPTSLVTETIAILAKRGAGKTYTAGVIAEELLGAKLPVVVLDPVGVWWGLRSTEDGKSAGLAITVLGGDHGDAPLEATAGKIIADLVAAESVPMVLDLSSFSKGEVARFVTDFAEQLYRKNRNPLHVVIDEADAFAPQKPRPEQARMLGAIDDIVRRGRARGLGVTLVTQRSAVLNKDVLTQCEVLIALRTPHPNDRKPIQDWIAVHGTDEQHKEMMESLAGLGRGEAWVLSAAWLNIFQRVQIRRKWTFDSSRTPEAGERRVEPKVLATVDLDKLTAAMKETVERAEANDPAKLKAKVAHLEAELRKKVPPPAAPTKVVEVERVEVPALRKGEAEKLATVAERVANAVAQLVGLGASVREGLAAVASAPKAAPPHGFTQPSAPARPVALVRREPRAATPPSGADASVGNSGLRRMLIALAQRPRGLTNKQLGVRAGVSSKSGTFSTYLGKARSNGWVEGSGHVTITPAGVEALGSYEPLPEGPALAEYWLGQLGNSGASRMLRALLDAYPAGLDNATLGERAQISNASGTFSTYLGKLRSLELVTGRGQVRASEELIGGAP